MNMDCRVDQAAPTRNAANVDGANVFSIARTCCARVKAVAAQLLKVMVVGRHAVLLRVEKLALYRGGIVPAITMFDQSQTVRAMLSMCSCAALHAASCAAVRVSCPARQPACTVAPP